MKKTMTVLTALLLVAAMSVSVVAEDSTYVGTKKCRMCHKKESAGAQFAKWQNGPHAKAYTRLATDEAKAVAAELGIDNPQEADACLKCHVTGFEAAAEAKVKLLPENGVSCEACHGAGSAYWKKATMKGVRAGDIDPASVGIIAADEALCVTCHNEESPTFKGFDYEARLKDIAHPVPPPAAE